MRGERTSIGRVDADAVDAKSAGARNWQEFLSSELRCPVRVTYTRARRTPLQVRPVKHRASPSARAPARAKPGGTSSGRRPSSTARAATSGLEVRMHAMFDGAPPHVHDAVVRWIRSGRRAPRACELLDRWILESLERLPRTRELALDTRGDAHDLAALATEIFTGELAAEFVDEARRPRVTWGRKGQSRTRHSLRLGSFDAEDAIVRIHPVLDQPAVPVWFVRYVLFHELLHAVLPPRRGRGSRWIHHGAEFRRRERDYADFARAIAWEDAHMPALIRSARRGTPMRAAPLQAQPPAQSSSRAALDVAARPKRRASRPAALVRLVQAWLFPA